MNLAPFAFAIGYRLFAPPPQEGELCYTSRSRPVAEGAIVDGM